MFVFFKYVTPTALLIIFLIVWVFDIENIISMLYNTEVSHMSDERR